ncbi:hypothetical protein [Enterococcus olivae]
MNIIYPPLVEESIQFHFLGKEREQAPKAAMYRMMVEKGIITENGSPTEAALQNGWIKDFYEEENLSFQEFIELYPLFEQYDSELFQKIDGFWEIPVNLKEELLKELSTEELDHDKKIQIEAYLADR